MRSRSLLLLAAVGASLTACVGDAPVAPADPVVTPLPALPTSVAEPYVVLFTGDSEAGAAAAATARIIALAPSLRTASPGALVTGRVAEGEPLVEQLPALGAAMFRLTSAEARAVAADPGVAVVEPVRVATALQSTRAATLSWALDRTDAPSLPLDGFVTRRGASGSGARIAIFDTGIRWSHQELASRVVLGFDAFTGKVRTSGDSVGHGTAVAGTAGGRTLGLAAAAQFIDIKVLNGKGSGTSLELVRGVDFLLAERRKNPAIPVVANFSLGFAGGSVVIDSAVARLVNAGIPVVAAAGNDGGNACNVSPARLPAAITVGASDQSDARATFSNAGSCVDLFAGGVQVRAPWMTADNAVVLISGTSLSAPVVTGAIASALAANPKASPAQLAAWLTRDAVAGKLRGLPTGTANRLLQFSTLALPAAAAPAPAPSPAPPPPAPAAGTVSAAFTVACTKLACLLASQATGASALAATYAWNLGPVTYRGVGAQRLGVTYAAAGTYAVTLEVTDAAGRVSRSTQQFSVKP